MIVRLGLTAISDVRLTFYRMKRLVSIPQNLVTRPLAGALINLRASTRGLFCPQQVLQSYSDLAAV
jgi:hypothetical protein